MKPRADFLLLKSSARLRNIAGSGRCGRQIVGVFDMDQTDGVRADDKVPAGLLAPGLAIGRVRR